MGVRATRGLPPVDVDIPVLGHPASVHTPVKRTSKRRPRNLPQRAFYRAARVQPLYYELVSGKPTNDKLVTSYQLPLSWYLVLRGILAGVDSEVKPSVAPGQDQVFVCLCRPTTTGLVFFYYILYLLLLLFFAAVKKLCTTCARYVRIKAFIGVLLWV